MKKIFYVIVALCVAAYPLAAQTKANETKHIKLATTFIGLLNENKFSAAHALFDDTMKQGLSEAKLRELWEGIKAAAGNFKKTDSLETAQKDAYTIVNALCVFDTMNITAQLVFNKSDKIAGLFFKPVEVLTYAPPPYADPKTFSERELSVGTTPWALPATLTLPNGAGPFPLVILVHGSGPHDRDSTVGPNKPFADLALGLASKGIAVLRYEKRTYRYREQCASMQNFTVKEESIDDALAAVQTARTLPEIDQKALFILGHSLGGTVIPRIAAQAKTAAGCILLAASLEPLEDAVVRQSRYIAMLDGSISIDEHSALSLLEQIAGKIKKLGAADKKSPELFFNAPASYWLDLASYKPLETAKTLTQPLLIMQGGRDYQVTVKDFEAWQAGLAAKKNATFKFFSTLNHLFMEGSTKPSPDEYQFAGHIASEVINEIAMWIYQTRRR